MTDSKLQPPRRKSKVAAGIKLRDADKVKLIPVAVEDMPQLRKPEWIRIRMGGGGEVQRIKDLLRKHGLATVCEEANCPNLSECFGGGTATFMIMGEVCTRRCPFCDVGHGKPKPLDVNEPEELAKAISEMGLKYVVITSVDRDDLRDGGADHFAQCIERSRHYSPNLQVEILTPDFRGRMEPAIEALTRVPPDVFNHNLETVPRLYLQARPGASYDWSLDLLQEFKRHNPKVPTKSGLMVGMGETVDELKQVLRDLREHDVNMLTVGQYLQPSRDHYPVHRYMHPDEFAELEDFAYSIGFAHAACGPLVRSSYHADQQAHGTFPSVTSGVQQG